MAKKQTGGVINLQVDLEAFIITGNYINRSFGNMEEADSCRKYLLKNRERLRYPLFSNIFGWQ